MCVFGERACPPEDCGGAFGYERLLNVLSKPGAEKYKDMVAWLKGHAKNHFPYRPNDFSIAEVEFWNPAKRWKLAFGKSSWCEHFSVSCPLIQAPRRLIPKRKKPSQTSPLPLRSSPLMRRSRRAAAVRA
ncbi:MAG: plasmid pRiA4b ORF-3 family protein [Zoogloeaceae bacterium]|nr:plasmid pRiA4b ORF-3 family protein [Zoogloeaceae bacterium]